MAKLFKGLSVLTSGDSAGRGSVAVITQADTARRIEILDDFEHAGIGWLWATDSEARLIYISESAAEKLDRPIGDLLGQPLVKLFETDSNNASERSDRPLKFPARRAQSHHRPDRPLHA